MPSYKPKFNLTITNPAKTQTNKISNHINHLNIKPRIRTFYNSNIKIDHKTNSINHKYTSNQRGETTSFDLEIMGECN